MKAYNTNCLLEQFKALNSIQSRICWCLTGTLIQNSLEDLGSLIRFLGMLLFNEPAAFKKYVAMVRLRKGSDTAELENLRPILSSICLQRSRSILPSKGYTRTDAYGKKRRAVSKLSSSPASEQYKSATKTTVMTGPTIGPWRHSCDCEYSATMAQTHGEHSSPLKPAPALIRFSVSFSRVGRQCAYIVLLIFYRLAL